MENSPNPQTCKVTVEDLIPTDLVTADVLAIGDTINDKAYLITNAPYAIFCFKRR